MTCCPHALGPKQTTEPQPTARQKHTTKGPCGFFCIFSPQQRFLLTHMMATPPHVISSSNLTLNSTTTTTPSSSIFGGVTQKTNENNNKRPYDFVVHDSNTNINNNINNDTEQRKPITAWNFPTLASGNSNNGHLNSNDHNADNTSDTDSKRQRTLFPSLLDLAPSATTTTTTQFLPPGFVLPSSQQQKQTQEEKQLPSWLLPSMDTTIHGRLNLERPKNMALMEPAPPPVCPYSNIHITSHRLTRAVPSHTHTHTFL